MSFMPGSTYKAAVLVAPRRIELRDLSIPMIESHEALVRVHAAGVCGTDLALESGDYRATLPLVLGHEWVGSVEAVGDARDSALPGRRVVGEINNHCLARRFEEPCAACTAGLPTHCLTRTVTGIDRHPGAFAERLIAPSANLLPVPDDLPDAAAILIEPLAAALQTFEMTPLAGGETVVVLGCGRLGVLAALVAQALGARVLAFARRPAHRELAARVGVEVTLAASDGEIVEQVRKATRGLGVDLVVEATGSADGLALALACVRPRGTIALKSTPGLPAGHFDLTRAVVNEVRLQGSRCGSFARALAFWERHRPPLERLVEAEFPLDQIARALARARDPGKVMIRCSK
jgi:threonine dehydrogenase-like Zn-dependent dehydrogenase